jgi:protein-tyrosine kinase
MERIKLAIERARQQASTAAAPAATRPSRPVRPPSIEQPLETGPAVADLGAPVDLRPLDRAHLERNRIVTLDRENPLRGPFDLLRTQVLQKMQEHGWRTLAITSPSVQSGKTVVATNLALSIAHHPERTALLVDFDLRHPRVATYLGLPDGTSLNEVLAGQADLQSAIVHAGIPGFLALPTHRKVPGAGEVLASERVGRILHALRDDYPERIVVLDLPPVTAVDDVIAVLPRVDCVLLVVGSGSSTKQEIEEARRHLARCNLLGVVVNKVSGPTARYAYY